MTAKDIMEITEKGRDIMVRLVNKKEPDVVSIAKEGQEWRVIIEVLERKAVPDTQDILGIYEVLLDDSKELLRYKRIGQRRRATLGMEEVDNG